MFESYKNNTQDESLYRKKVGASIILSLIVSPFVFLFIFNWLESDTAQEPEALPRVEASMTAEKVCASLPKPEKMELIEKTEPKNDYEMQIVIYRYASPRRAAEILPVYLFWLNENGWQRDPNDELTFRKSNFGIYISHNPADSMTNYEILCSEKRTWIYESNQESK